MDGTVSIDVLCTVSEYVDDRSLHMMRATCHHWWVNLPTVLTVKNQSQFASLINSDTIDHIRTINCNVAIGESGVNTLVTSLERRNCYQLRKVDLTRNQVHNTVDIITRMLTSNHFHLTQLTLQWNSLTDSDVITIAEAMKHHCCMLQTLDISFNDIYHEGIAVLSNVLRTVDHCHITVLYLSANNIGDIGVQEIAQAVESPKCRLKELHLASNSITDTGMESLCTALISPHCRITQLDLAGNSIKEGAIGIGGVLGTTGCTIEHLDLAGNNIDDTGVLQIATGMENSRNCRLHSLDLSYNIVGDIGTQAIAAAMVSGCCRLEKLELSEWHQKPKKELLVTKVCLPFFHRMQGLRQCKDAKDASETNATMQKNYGTVKWNNAKDAKQAKRPETHPQKQ
eukprot:NODE_129_length_1432_cov_538.675862_g125_i0.p1 GENE.NODE_129_length_1432_cov_538.675862_g125_i0~~NODE_129_length_1432_cov_538.675862_g125_i0.p1  ORF type:complete len:398 (-),score=87.95 NODE_129_length_1432_cov_538.675862_g125_i0:40-1233(-)